MAALFIILLFGLPAGDDAFKSKIPGLGSITLPEGEWKQEESHTPVKGAHAYVFKKDSQVVERITIVRFDKTNGNREMTLRRSYGLCDMMADSVCEGLPSLWGVERKRTGENKNELGIGHMIRLPREKDREPLAVTNIYPDHSGANWMNHGLIASNERFIFLFVHTSTRILSPEEIEEVYSSSSLLSWPDQSEDGKGYGVERPTDSPVSD